jgi:hypothetical protein
LATLLPKLLLSTGRGQDALYAADLGRQAVECIGGIGLFPFFLCLDRNSAL